MGAFLSPELGERLPDWNDNVDTQRCIYDDGSAYVGEKGVVTYCVKPPTYSYKNKKTFMAGFFDGRSELEANIVVWGNSYAELEEYVYEMIKYIHGPGCQYYEIYKVIMCDEDNKDNKKSLWGFLLKKYVLKNTIYNKEEYDPYIHDTSFESENESESKYESYSDSE